MQDVKTIKNEGVKNEQGLPDSDCYIDKIDYSKKIPDFSKCPKEVIIKEL